MNHTLKLLLFSDLFLLTGFGLISPILAIFVKDTMVGGTIFTAGIATAIFLIVKASVQVPFSKYIDKHDHKVKWVVTGTLFQTFVPVIYFFSNNINGIYIAQIVYGIGGGMAAASWLSLWSKHLDKNHESFEWSTYSATIGIGAGITAVVGAYIAQVLGFVYTLLFVEILTLTGFFILLGLTKKDEEDLPDVSTHYHKRRKSHDIHH